MEVNQKFKNNPEFTMHFRNFNFKGDVVLMQAINGLIYFFAAFSGMLTFSGLKSRLWSQQRIPRTQRREIFCAMSGQKA